MKLKRILGSVICAFSLMAAGIGAQAANPPVHTAVQGTEQVVAQTAAQVRTAVKIGPQNADIYVEGIPATFPSEDGKTVYTALSYNGSTYMPLRTVGRWMGKNISWDNASRTVFLSGTTEKSYPCADDDAYH